MQKLFSLLLPLALAGMNFCCATSLIKGQLSPNTPDTWPILEASNKFGSGQVCPVRDPVSNKIWLATAQHLIDPDFIRSDRYYNVRMQIEDRIFDSRIAFVDPVVDLAYLKPPDDLAVPYYEVAAQPARIGDKLWFVGYDWKNADVAFHRDIIESKMTMFTAGKIVYKPGGEGGSSGSCILNEAGEVVGINVTAMNWIFGDSSGQAVAFHAGIAFRGLEEYLEKDKLAKEKAAVLELLQQLQ
jgi:hypothetical protein